MGSTGYLTCAYAYSEYPSIEKSFTPYDLSVMSGIEWLISVVVLSDDANVNLNDDFLFPTRKHFLQ